MKMNRAYIELHTHLDGAITVDIANRLVEILGKDSLPDFTVSEDILSVPQDCRNLEDFLNCFSFPLSLLQTRECICEAVFMEQEEMKKEGVIYAEIRFAPQLHTKKGLSQREVIEAALKGLRRSDLPCNLILCCMRGADVSDANDETVKLAEEFMVEDNGVVAVDLAGAEGCFPTSDYINLFEMVKDKKIPFTVHAGEAAGSESIRCAVEMGATRIGHGVALYQDRELIKEVREKGITLEMCPTSNRLTRAVPDMQSYPLKEYLELGIRVTINTDDKAVCRTCIGKEFEYIRNNYGITRDQEKQMLIYAAESSFAGQLTKETILQKIEENWHSVGQENGL